MKRDKKSVRRLPLEKRAEMAFRDAVDEVIAEHARLGLPLYIWRQGRLVALSAQEARGGSQVSRGK